MVTHTGRFFTWLLSRLLSGVVFTAASLAATRDAHARGRVIYVMRSASLLDYLYFNFAFQQHGLRLVRFANGVNTWSARPFWSALRTGLRGRRGLPKDPECFEATVRLGEPTMLFLGRRGRGPSDHRKFSHKFLRKLPELAAETEEPILLVPMLLVWDKHPDHHEPTIFDEVFGTRQEPRLFRKGIQLAKQTWESFLNLGAPQVQIGKPIELTAGGEEYSVDRLDQELSERLELEQRLIVGPGIKSARQIREEILADPRTVEAIREVTVETGADYAAEVKRSGDLLKKMSADFRMIVVKLFASLLSAVFSQIYDGLDVDEEGVERVRETARTKRVVLVPSHKSHIDYLVLSYVFYNSGLIPPHIAAGDNLSFWPLGPIFRRSGAFFLRRSFKGDPLYPKIFNAYLVKLLEEGFFLEFFIEGTRSRTGKLNPPKYGMLNMLFDAHRFGGVDNLAFVPVSVGYENVIESSSYRAELEGGEKRSESIAGLIRSSQILRSRYGRVYVEFGEPIDAKDFVAEYHPDGARDLERAELDRTVRRLAYRIIHRINDVTTVTPSAMAALVALNNPAKAIDTETLTREIGFMLSFLRARNARFSGSLERALEARFASIRGLSRTPINVKAFDDYDQEFVEDQAAGPIPSADSIVRKTDHALGDAVLATLEEALGLLEDKKLVEIHRVDGETLYVVPDDRRTELAFYKNNIIHYFVPEAVFATAIYVVEGSEVALDEVRSYTLFLSRLLKQEFCFEDSDRFEEVFNRTIDYFEDRGWVTRIEHDRLRIADPPPAGAEFLRGLLLPTIEAYYIAVDSAVEFAPTWVDEKSLLKQSLDRGEAQHLKGHLSYREGITKATLTNAIRVLAGWGVLERRDEPGALRRAQRQVQISEEYRGELIFELRDNLRAMIARQKRVPGELLRRI